MATASEGTYHDVVTKECLKELIEFFASCTTPYRARHVDRRYEIVEKMCLHLLARDYIIQTVDNSNGQLCSHYPAHIYIMEGHIDNGQIKVNTVSQLKELIKVSKVARSLSRFPVPVILFENKNICRSSTLSTAVELLGRASYDWMFSSKEKSSNEMEELPRQYEKRPSEWTVVDRAREFDSQLLSTLGVKLVCDLMVEMRKTQYGVILTSSEKADGSLWYSKFNLASLPYPGCEFFVNYRQRNDRIEELHYNWELSINDATICVPSPLSESVGIDFQQYKMWNIIEHTQNYMKLLLHYLKFEMNGLLIHCVAGWDRTPLFVSLLRLSLWADGSIHKSLSPGEVLYLTLAYDWFIFGHKFEERLHKREEVLYYCFDFLQYITSDDYSVSTTPTTTTHHREEIIEHVDTSVTDSLSKVSVSVKDKYCLYQPSLLANKVSLPLKTFVDQNSMRARKLLTVRELFCEAYGDAVTTPTMAEPQSGPIWGRIVNLFQNK